MSRICFIKNLLKKKIYGKVKNILKSEKINMYNKML